MLKEFKPENVNPVADLKNKLRQIIDIILDTTPISDSHFLLFFLMLQRDGYFYELKKLGRDSVKKQIHNLILNSTKENSKLLIEIYRVFEPTIQSLNKNIIYQLVDIFCSLDQNVLKHHFSEIFDDSLGILYRMQGKSASGHIMPSELSRFICELVTLPEKAKIYNPFSGIASFCIFSADGLDYLGQEVNQTAWALGSLRIMAYDKIHNSKYIKSNSITQWNPTQNEKFDLIVSNPPFVINLQENIVGKFGKIRSCEQFLIEKGVEDLTENGKLIVIVPHGFLFRSGSEQELRRFLVDNELLEMVISFPGGLLMNSNIPINILVINKKKNGLGSVCFIDAHQFVMGSTSREKRLNDYALNSFIKNNKESEFRRIVNKNIIKQFEYNLSVARYFQKEYDGVTLRQIGSVLKGQKVSLGQLGKYIRIRDLKNDKLNYQLGLSLIDDVAIPGYAQEITESCILLATRWSELKPTYFNFMGTPIYISSDIIALKIDQSKADIDYLITELHSVYVLDQLDSYRIGETISYIKRDDILRLKIQLPSLDIQFEKKHLLKKEILKVEEQKIINLRKETEIDIADQNSYLRHQIAGPLRNIRSSTKNIRAILDKYMPEIKPDYLYLKLNDSATLTLGNYLEILERDLKAINKSTQKAGLDIELKDLSISKIDIVQFIKDYYAELKEIKNKIFEIELNILDEDLYSLEGNKAFIKGDRELIRKMFNNLIENAERHAFQNRYSIKNRVEIDLICDFQAMKVQIDFTNTGLQVEKGFSLEKFIIRGMKTGPNGGDGIGLWYVNEIVKIHDGELGFTDETGGDGLAGDLSSTFEIKFPIEIDNNDDEI